ncbi:hypothetical protein UFOVP29_181 [uncultured Caudovirales phage]|uniref:Uncharacterized protein n=1 Tax=uncultured Caudovirales phage TaxID=2100421 RepID=A0A6J5KPD7_9CAUD|nr:hypothetical protein UFOVP29_181 [uncultured Caudovirales phage]
MDNLEERRKEFEKRIKWAPEHPGEGWVQVTPELAERIFLFEIELEEGEKQLRELIDKACGPLEK